MKPIIGTPRFKLEALVLPRAPFHVSIDCLLCGAGMRPTRGAFAAVYRVGKELVGVVCDDCLSPETRENLARVRERAKASR